MVSGQPHMSCGWPVSFAFISFVTMLRVPIIVAQGE